MHSRFALELPRIREGMCMCLAELRGQLRRMPFLGNGDLTQPRVSWRYFNICREYSLRPPTYVGGGGHIAEQV